MRSIFRETNGWERPLINSDTVIKVGSGLAIALASIGVVAHGTVAYLTLTNSDEINADLKSSISTPVSETQSKFSAAATGADTEKVQVFGIDAPDGGFTDTIAIPAPD